MQEQHFSLTSFVPDVSLLFSSGDPKQLTAITFVVIAGLLLYFLIKLLREFHIAKRRTAHVAALVEGVDKAQLPTVYRELRARARERSETVGDLWNEFHESLVYSERDDRVYNTLDAGHFFNPYSLARGLTDNRQLAAVPGFLTAIGVIGTFAGLQMGLSGLDLSSGDVQVLIDGIKGMIQGASVAFISSLWGVLASVLFNAMEKSAERQVRSRIADLQNRLDYLFPRITAEHSLREIQEQSAQSTEALQGLAERIGDKMQEALVQSSQAIRSGLEESLERILAPALAKLAENAEDNSRAMLERLTDTFLDRVGSQADAQRDALAGASNSINQAIESLADNLKTSGQAQQEREERMSGKMDELLGRVVGEFERQVGSMGTVEADRARRMQEQLKASEEARQQHEARMSSEVTGLLQNVVSTFGQQAEAIGAADAQRTQKLTEQLEALGGVSERLADLKTSFGELVDAHRATIDANRKNTVAMAETTRQFDSFAKNIDQATTKLASGVDGALESAGQVSNAAQQTMLQAQQLLEQGGQLSSRLNEVITEVREISKYSNGGLETVEQYLRQSQEHLKEHVAELKESVQSLLDEYADRVKSQTVERLSTWNEQTEQFTRSMVDSVKLIQDVIDEMEAKGRPAANAYR